MTGPSDKHRAPRFTGLRAIEKNGLKGFGFSIRFGDDTDTHSPDTPPVEADKTGEASPPASSPVGYPWLTHGFNPDEVA